LVLPLFGGLPLAAAGFGIDFELLDLPAFADFADLAI
jgi:hypothetical protein